MRKRKLYFLKLISTTINWVISYLQYLPSVKCVEIRVQESTTEQFVVTVVRVFSNAVFAGKQSTAA